MARALLASTVLLVVLAIAVICTAALSTAAVTTAAPPDVSVVGDEVDVVRGDTDSVTLTTTDARNATVNASFTDRTVVAEPPSTNATLAVTAPRDDAVLLTAERFTTDQLEAVVDGTATDHGLRVAVPEDGEIPIRIPYETLCRLEPERTPSAGNFTFTVRGVESLESDTATLHTGVTSEARQWIHRDSIPVGRSGHATVTIEQERTRCWDGSWVTIEDEDGTAVVNVTVTDANDDGRVTIEFDTSHLTRSPARAVTATGPDVVEDVTPGQLAGDPQLPTGTYRVRIDQDVAVLRINESATGKRTTNPSPTSGRTNGTHTSTPESTSDASPDATTSATGTTPVTGPGFAVGATVLAILALALTLVGVVRLQ